MSKTAIIVLTDPKSGTDESLGRVFNALAAAYDHKKSGEDVKVYFQGTGSRWPQLLQLPEHPLNKLFLEVSDKIEGVSDGCAIFFGANTDGFNRVSENHVPGTTGLPSLVKLQRDGFRIMTF